VFATDAMIPAHGTYLIGNYAGGDDVKSTLSTSLPTSSPPTISLSNSAVAIELRDASDNPVDIVGDGGTPAAGASLPIKLTMVRTNPLLAGTDESAWSSAVTVATNLIADVSDLGTPGICDGCAQRKRQPETPAPLEPTPVEPEPDSRAGPISGTRSGTRSSCRKSDNVDRTNADHSRRSLRPKSLQTEIPNPHGTGIFCPAGCDGRTRTPEARLRHVAAQASSLRIQKVEKNGSKSFLSMRRISSRSGALRFMMRRERSSPSRILHAESRTTSTYVRIELTSSKLNNGGDTVVLYDPEGHLLDAVTYDSTAKGEVWVRFPSPDGSWRTSKTPNAGGANQWEAGTVAGADSDSSSQRPHLRRSQS
jgi:hypothetical protein